MPTCVRKAIPMLAMSKMAWRLMDHVLKGIHSANVLTWCWDDSKFSSECYASRADVSFPKDSSGWAASLIKVGPPGPPSMRYMLSLCHMCVSFLCFAMKIVQCAEYARITHVPTRSLIEIVSWSFFLLCHVCVR